jgi:hypothetical protein
LDTLSRAVVVLGPESTIEELVVVLAGEERLFGAHPDTGDDVVLNETTKGRSGRRDEVLAVGVSDVIGLGAGGLRLCEENEVSAGTPETEEGKDARAKCMFISSPSKSALYELLQWGEGESA